MLDTERIPIGKLHDLFCLNLDFLAGFAPNVHRMSRVEMESSEIVHTAKSKSRKAF